MIEGRVHAELKRQGGWQPMRAIYLSLGFDQQSVSDALSRLKERGAVEKRGDRRTATWRALEADLVDRRQFNGRKRDVPQEQSN